MGVARILTFMHGSPVGVCFLVVEQKLQNGFRNDMTQYLPCAQIACDDAPDKHRSLNAQNKHSECYGEYVTSTVGVQTLTSSCLRDSISDRE
jgi:hypothetical protein